VVLTFAAPQAGIGAEVAVAGADGTAWSDGPAQTSDVTVTQPLLPAMPDGAYSVTWRSVAQDGHPVSGTFGFTLQLPADPAADDADDATADVVAEPAGATATTSTPPRTVLTAADPVAPPAALDEQSGGGWRWWYWLVLLLGGAAVGTAAWRGRSARG
jgi:hypothetical protein